MSKPKLKVLQGQLVPGGDTDALPFRAPLPRTARIKNISDMKKDAIRLYRAARQGRGLDAAELGRWMYAGGQIASMMEKADIEPRLDEIEARLVAISNKLNMI